LGGPLFAPIGYFIERRRSDEEWKWAVDVFQNLGDLLDAHDLILSIEPVNRSETFFLRTASEATTLCEEIGHLRIGVTIDTFHANIEEKSILSEHPKAAIQEHLKSGHTFRRNVQDIDNSGRVSSLSQHGKCLEGRKETANHSLGTTGMVSAKDPRGHASASRDHQRLSARRRCGNMAAGKMEARK
jgi:sugar phosphate isomerase/epimerase